MLASGGGPADEGWLQTTVPDIVALPAAQRALLGEAVTGRDGVLANAVRRAAEETAYLDAGGNPIAAFDNSIDPP